MIQEIVARSLGRDIGSYRHFAGSMHLYDKHRADAESLIGEGFQSRIEMPEMPLGDPWPAIASALKSEARVRSGECFDANTLGLDAYWTDLVRMLQIYFCSDDERIESLMESMSFKRYRVYVLPRIGRTHGKVS
jgi:thymidylate synthase